MKSSDIRESFLNYFEDKGHLRIKSAPLVPEHDPTLFFVNAGMVPFKNVFTGQESIGTKRATSSQKCMRVSGKHNDLENVGRTSRHHTFFEMLGNFSFGDYFKKDAIRFAWEYLTQVLRLEKSRLWVTVFQEDHEAEELWKKVTDVPPERVLKRGEADNFWSMGETGPCGPCTEIHYDHGKEFGREYHPSEPEFDGNRYTEIWNLVFMQFNRAQNGDLTPLPKPSVDTGMGLERLACVVQGVHSNYDSDLFTPLLEKIQQLSGKKYGALEHDDVSMRVTADHIRATTFLIGDGVLPSNEGRGYVLRRIMRRAIRHGRLLGLKEAFFYKMVPEVVRQMEGVYPELATNEKFIQEVVRAEGERFLETLGKGLEIIEAEIRGVKKAGGKFLSGKMAFKLYDTFGFPVDLSEIIAADAGLHVDQAGFENLMRQQREKARSSWKGSGEKKQAEIYQNMVKAGLKTEFLGYQTLDCLSPITALIKNGKRVPNASLGEKVEIFTEYSPFYAESGGQVGDRGEIFSDEAHAVVTNTRSPASGLVAHYAKIDQGGFKVGEEVHLKVNPLTRGPTRLNHTATHLLHAALREILGDHVKQAGSLVAPDRLRFDFSHFQALTPEQIEAIEDRVNEKIREDLQVEKMEMDYDEAMKSGAMALFGEKYGEKVRVLRIDEFSTELCGGTHVDRTGEIGAFKILSESSAAAGVRRIEAITGSATLNYLRDLEKKWGLLAKKLKAAPEEVIDRVEKQAEQLRKMEREVLKFKSQVGTSVASQGEKDVMNQVQEIDGIKVLTLRRDIDDVKALRQLSDQLIHKIGSGLSVLGSAAGGKATLIVRVSKDLTPKLNAGEIVKELAAYVKGSGGGRADMAQAGGADVAGLDTALKKVYELVKTRNP